MTITIKKSMLRLSHKHIVGFYEETITAFGNGAKVSAKRKHIGRKVYVVVMEDGE